MYPLVDLMNRCKLGWNSEFLPGILLYRVFLGYRRSLDGVLAEKTPSIVCSCNLRFRWSFVWIFVEYCQCSYGVFAEYCRCSYRVCTEYCQCSHEVYAKYSQSTTGVSTRYSRSIAGVLARSLRSFFGVMDVFNRSFLGVFVKLIIIVIIYSKYFSRPNTNINSYFSYVFVVINLA